MGTTFVSIAENGFWMRDGILELWLRLVALHIEESPDDEFKGRKIRDQWLLASRGWFGGHVPHDLETFASSDEGQRIIRDAISSLMAALDNAPNELNADTINLLGIDGTYFAPLQSSQLIEVGRAFIDLLDGKVFGDATSTDFMPGSNVAT